MNAINNSYIFRLSNAFAKIKRKILHGYVSFRQRHFVAPFDFCERIFLNAFYARKGHHENCLWKSIILLLFLSQAVFFLCIQHIACKIKISTVIYYCFTSEANDTWYYMYMEINI